MGFGLQGAAGEDPMGPRRGAMGRDAPGSRPGPRGGCPTAEPPEDMDMAVVLKPLERGQGGSIPHRPSSPLRMALMGRILKVCICSASYLISPPPGTTSTTVRAPPAKVKRTSTPPKLRP